MPLVAVTFQTLYLSASHSDSLFRNRRSASQMKIVIARKQQPRNGMIKNIIIDTTSLKDLYTSGVTLSGMGNGPCANCIAEKANVPIANINEKIAITNSLCWTTMMEDFEVFIFLI
jgi:hypothetical protein